jgi:hypothetical protein
MMEFTDEELDELHSFLSNETMYGDDEIVYTEVGDLLRAIEKKVRDEAKRRKLWWA